MKTKLIPILLAAATICGTDAQSSTRGPSAENRETSRSTATLNGQDELSAAKERLALLRLQYSDVHPEVVAAKKRIAELEGLSAYGSVSAGGGSSASIGRYGQRLQSIVRRGDSALPGSIIVTTAMSQQKLDELSEDLTVLNYIFTRNYERTFGEKTTDYRLGVAMTMSGGRLVETSYLEDFGVLVKVHVPFALLASTDSDKKVAPTASANSEWEKARRALFGAPADVSTDGTDAGVFDEKILGELKNQLFDALKSAANIRHLEASQPITVVVIGGPNAPKTAAGWRSTILTIRVTKAQADAAAKDSGDLSKAATIIAYLDAPSAPRTVTTYGGYGGSSYAPAGVGIAR